MHKKSPSTRGEIYQHTYLNFAIWFCQTSTPTISALTSPWTAPEGTP